MSNNLLVLTARVVSLFFQPSLLPVVAFGLLFFFSYLSYTPWFYRLFVLTLVVFFTQVLPGTAIYFYRRLNGWTRRELSQRRRRIVPYVFSILSYCALLYIMTERCMPRFTLGIIVGALAIQAACVVANTWLKVSTHAAGAGGVIGEVAAFAWLLGFDPLLPVCATILLSGVVCTARLVLREHTHFELGLGTAIGIACGFLSLILV